MRAHAGTIVSSHRALRSKHRAGVGFGSRMWAQAPPPLLTLHTLRTTPLTLQV